MFWSSDRKPWLSWQACLVALTLAVVAYWGRESGAFGMIDKMQALAVPAGLSHDISDGMAFSPRGELLALPRYKGPVDLFDMVGQKWEVLPPAKGARESLAWVAFSKSGRSLAVMNWGRGITIWDVASKKPGVVLPLDPEIQANTLTFLDDDSILQLSTMRATGEDVEDPWDYGVVRWNVSTGERRDTEDFGRHPITMTVSPNGRYGVFTNVDDMTFHDFKAGGKPLDLGSSNQKAIFSADGLTLVVCKRTSISLLDVPSCREQRRLAVDPPFDSHHHLSLSSDKRLLAVGSYPKGGSAAVISLATGKVLDTVTCGPDSSLCRSVQLSPDGHTLATNTHAVNSKDRPSTPDLKLWKIPAAW